MHFGIGVTGGIHSIVWFEDCYLIKIANYNAALIRIPTAIILLGAFFIF
jgi:hypothetical protein